MNLTPAENLFSSTINPSSLDDISISESKRLFIQYRDAGVISGSCSFEDDKWQTTDEYSNVGLRFSVSPFMYKKYEHIFNMPLKSFKDYIKAYCLSIFGKNVLNSISYTLLDIKHLLATDPQEVIGENAGLNIYSPNRLGDFLSLFVNDENSDLLGSLISSLDYYADMTDPGFGRLAAQRELADFPSYFEFDDIIKRFWKEELDESERLFYYPLYIWWNITAVIPLRPREFLLTERNCLSKDTEGNYFLRLRRNQLKGTREKVISYKIRDSYLIQTIPVPDRTGELIEAYLKYTDKYEDTEIDTLFVTDPHYYKWGQSKHSNSRFLTYVNMNTILRYFFREVVHERYGYTVIYNGEKADHGKKEIRFIHLGDTRHIAFINLMQEGASPVTAMLLGGHENISMASQYYSNVIEFIECKTYREYRKSLSGDVQYNITPLNKLPAVRDFRRLNDGGRCYSREYLNGSIKDCMNISGHNGEIGYCPECPFYRANGHTYFSGDDIYKRRIKEDSKALLMAIRSVMEGKGNPETIGEAVLRARSSSLSYKAYLDEKYTHGGDENGKTKAD